MKTLDDLANVYCVVCGRFAGKIEDGTVCGEGHTVKVWSIDGPLGNWTKDGKEPDAAPYGSWRDRPSELGGVR